MKTPIDTGQAPATGRTAIYARLSQDRPGLGVAVERQVRLCRETAEARGLTILERDIFEENDTSASSRRPRLVYNALLAAVIAGTYSTVIVWHTDRLHRKPIELEAWIDAAEASGTSVVAVRAGLLDLSTAGGRATARLLGAMARHETELRSERQVAATHDAAMRGERTGGGGTRPFGYNQNLGPVLSNGRAKRVLTINEAEASVIRGAAKDILDGMPLRRVVANFANEQIPTVGGKAAWSAQVLKKILVNGLISGQREYQPRARDGSKRLMAGPIVAPGNWPAIITPQQTADLRAELIDRAVKRQRAPRRCLLTGILTCGHCGRTMMGRPRADGEMRYFCQKPPGGGGGCGKTFILADPTDLVVAEIVATRWDDVPPDLAGSDDETLSGPANEIQRIDARIVQIGIDYDDALISRKEWIQRREPLSFERTRLQDTLARNAASRTRSAAITLVGGQPLRTKWPTLDLDQRRVIIQAVMKSIVCGPGVRGRNQFDRSRIKDPVWVI